MCKIVIRSIQTLPFPSILLVAKATTSHNVKDVNKSSFFQILDVQARLDNKCKIFKFGSSSNQAYKK